MENENLHLLVEGLLYSFGTYNQADYKFMKNYHGNVQKSFLRIRDSTSSTKCCNVLLKGVSVITETTLIHNMYMYAC